MPDLPALWRERLSAYTFTRQTIGESHAEVFRLDAPDQPALFIKSEAISPFAQLPAEIARLRWLQTMSLPAASVLDVADHGDRHYLLMSAVPGADMASWPKSAASDIIATLASALRRLHDTPTAACPFDLTLATMLPHAKAHMDAGLVDETDFDDERLGQRTPELYARLIANRPPETDLVVGHGDACLPNFLMLDGKFTGYIDTSRLGIADRQADLAICTRSIAFNLGEDAVAPFLKAYGADLDPSRAAYYRLLDEFL
ncbi:APH(3') family aminoglycoside O-phosphotransferase [Devosia sp.]|uniref:APH(3') family aminoglycoside O-phosphotransferase n=1 Tax=Devosia sp. TaxID=1871048 RepID=UPI003266405D